MANADYRPYYPMLLEAWDRKDYKAICDEIATDYSKIAVFCVDLFHHGRNSDFIQLALEFAKYDGGIDMSRIVCVVQTCLEHWDRGMTEHDDALCDEVAGVLLSGSKSQLVTFISSVLYCGDPIQGVYRCGYLTGKLSKQQNG